MKRHFFCFSFVFLIAVPALAQAAPQIVDLNKGYLQWAWSQGDPTQNGPADGFDMNCTSGTVVVKKQVADPAARKCMLTAIPLTIGTWTCTVDAYNAGGTSGQSNAVSFQASLSPSLPTGLSVGQNP